MELRQPCFRKMLTPFRETTNEESNAVRVVEVRKSIRQLPTGEAPGPDCIPAELYKDAPAAAPNVTTRINAIYASGDVSSMLRALFVVTITKPDEYPLNPAN